MRLPFLLFVGAYAAIVLGLARLAARRSRLARIVVLIAGAVGFGVLTCYGLGLIGRSGIDLN
jgi:hypothetical protein